MTEAEIQADGIRYAKSLGCMTIRLHKGRGAQVGDPDVMFLPRLNVTAPNRRGEFVFFIEYKAPSKKASPIQLQRHAKLRKQGYNVYVCDSKDASRKAIAHELGA